MGKCKLRAPVKGFTPHSFDNRHGRASGFQPVQIKKGGKKRSVVKIEQVTPGQVASKGPAPLHYLSSTGAERFNRDVRFV